MTTKRLSIKTLMKLDTPVTTRRNFTVSSSYTMPTCLQKPHQTYEGYPSVTQVIHLLNNEEIVHWANKLGRAGRDVTIELEKASIIGSCTHFMIEREFTQSKKLIRQLDNDIQEIRECSDAGMNQRIDNAYVSFHKWYLKNPDYEPIQTEQSLISEKYGYGGTLDSLARWKNNLFLFDYKTSTNFYYTQFIQLSAYWKLLKEHDQEIQAVTILKLDKSKGCKAKTMVFQLEELKPYFKLFKSLLKTHTHLEMVKSNWTIQKETNLS